MKKIFRKINQLVISIIMLGFSFTVLYIGKSLFGPDATLLWASGMLSYFGMCGVIDFMFYLWRLKKEKKVVVNE